LISVAVVTCCRFVEGNSLWDNVKKIAMASFAMKATERDPDFVDNFAKVGAINMQHHVSCELE
jgi:hypothetical protein